MSFTCLTTEVSRAKYKEEVMGSKNLYSRETKEEAVRRYKAGDKMETIAKGLGIISMTSVGNWAKKAGVPQRQPHTGSRTHTPVPVDTSPTWEQTKQVMLDAFELAAKVPALESYNSRLRNKVAALENELKVLTDTQSKAKSEDQRYKQALFTGQIHNPVVEQPEEALPKERP